jgi:hypothetical protein
MPNPRDRELAEQLPSLSYHLRWRDGGWVRTPLALPTPETNHVVAADEAAPPTPEVGVMLATPAAQPRLSSPREHLATLLRTLARRLDYAGNAR